jgi:hypothetical protein
MQKNNNNNNNNNSNKHENKNKIIANLASERLYRRFS